MDKTDNKPDDTKTPIWLTKEQASARLGKPVSVLQHLQYRGYLHPVLRSGIRLYALAEVEALARPGRRPSPWIASPPMSGPAPSWPMLPAALAAPKDRKPLTSFDCSSKA